MCLRVCVLEYVEKCEGIYFSSVHVYVKMYTVVIVCCSVLQCVAVCCSVLLHAHIEESHVFFSCCNLPSIADGSCHTFE